MDEGPAASTGASAGSTAAALQAAFGAFTSAFDVPTSLFDPRQWTNAPAAGETAGEDRVAAAAEEASRSRAWAAGLSTWYLERARDAAPTPRDAMGEKG